MNKYGKQAVVAGLLIITVVSVFVWLRGTSREPSLNVLLITLDTTRADRIGAYGYEQAHTPVLDQLARDGVLFERAISPAPLTLPAHASLFTGLYPPEHGLRTNGYGSLPESNQVLSEILSQAGFDTSAFVASFVLDRKFGLNRGFQHYDDNLADAEPTQDAIHRFRDGRLVVDSALEWLTSPRDKPFFCWVHLYDPHFPYEPHTVETEGVSTDVLYDGEITYTDQQVGRLLEQVTQHPRTVVVVVGDHGESLGDHSELQHGYTLYDSTQHVPLIVQGVPDVQPGTRVSTTVSLVDLLPTLLELLNLPEADGISGRSLMAGLSGQPLEQRPCYGTTDDPFLQNGWSPLRSLTTDRWRYIRTTRPELYDLQADPQELTNLAGEDPEQVQKLEGQLVDLESSLAVGQAAEVQLSGAEQRALASLGYVSGGTRQEAPQQNDLPDVKDMLPFNTATQSAIDMLDQGRFAEAETALRKIVSESPPEHVSSRLYLGTVLEQQDQTAEAEKIYQKVLECRPDDSAALFHLGALYADLGRFEEAIQIFEKCLIVEPESTETLFNLGLAKSRTGDAAAAERIFRQVLQIDPLFPGAWAGLGTLYSRQRRPADAMAAFQSELKLNPDSIEAHINLGVQLGGQQRFEQAREHFKTATELAPESIDARFNLGICEEMLHNYDAAIFQVQKAIKLAPESPGLRTALGNIYLKSGQKAEAIEAFESEIELTPDWIPAHIQLAMLMSEQQRIPEAIKHLETVVRLEPANVQALLRIGSLYAEVGNRDKAIKSLGKVLRIQPGNSQATEELARIRSLKP